MFGEYLLFPSFETFSFACDNLLSIAKRNHIGMFIWHYCLFTSSDFWFRVVHDIQIFKKMSSQKESSFHIDFS